jgi:hypothetical protein
MIFFAIFFVKNNNCVYIYIYIYMNVAFWKIFVPKNKLIPNIIKRQFFEFLISEWAEQHGLRAKGQVKFRKGYLTTNQLFIL